MGPLVSCLVSPARLELAYSNYGDPLRGRCRRGDLREQVLIPCPRIRRQHFVLGVDAGDFPLLAHDCLETSRPIEVQAMEAKRNHESHTGSSETLSSTRAFNLGQTLFLFVTVFSGAI